MALCQLTGKSKTFTLLEKTSILDRRARLQSRIDAFNQKRPIFMPHANWDELSTDGLPLGSFVEEEDDDWDDDNDNEQEHGLPDPASISMPSAFGKDRCLQYGWSAIAAEEIDLRVGQANECLKTLRLALGHKSLLLRQSVRNSKGKKARTRAWAQVTSIDDNIREEVLVYHLAR
jgi:hypothetical protein